MNARPILTTAAMRSAEQRAIDAGSDVQALMERAGAAFAQAALRFAGPLPALILVGPGNNGGDGYVAARHLAGNGVPVRIAAIAEPATEACRAARSAWAGPVEMLSNSTASAPLVIDALFGTGLTRALEPELVRIVTALCAQSVVSIACDVPSGVDSDSGILLNPVPPFAMTVAFGALKPAHRLMPAMHRCGRVVIADIGIAAASEWHEIPVPKLPALDPAGNKYDRGLVHCLAGGMPGAIALAATAAARAGAGYVRVEADRFLANVPAAVVQGQGSALDDRRIGALLLGPGFTGHEQELLDRAIASGRPLVMDATAIGMVGNPARLHGLEAILTPHAGEFARLFPKVCGNKAERALAAARLSRAMIVFKGPDTLVAAPDGRLAFAPPAPAWLATAGTGDVLAGLVAAMRARGLAPFEAASAGVWLHGRAARIAGPAMIADDLAAAIPRALAMAG